MKKRLMLGVSTCLFLFSTVLFTACSSDDDDDNNPVLSKDEPGKIAGLGDEEGELTGTKFKLPDGITLEGDITGFDEYLRSGIDKTKKQPVENILKSVSEAAANVDAAVGSGNFVQVYIILKNSNDRVVDVTFPAGMIVRSRSGNYQNGVLLKKAMIKVPANSVYKVALFMYCGNLSKLPSSTFEKYDWAVVSNSSLIMDLCNRLTNKKINVEEYASPFIDPNLSNYIHELQQILWLLTDMGFEMPPAQIKWIDELPNSK